MSLFHLKWLSSFKQKLSSFFEHKWLDIILWLLFIISFALMLISTSDPLPAIILGKWVVPLIVQFETIKQITFDLAVGVLVSLFMYVLVIRIPERAKKKRLKRNLLQHYLMFKEACLDNLLWACNEVTSTEKVKTLLNKEQFKAYFSENVTSSQNRWHAVINGLNDIYIEDIALELEIFRNEVEFVLSSVEINNPEALRLLKRLSEVLWRKKHDCSNVKGDTLKSLARFLWELFTGWNPVDGTYGNDSIDAIIKKL